MKIAGIYTIKNELMGRTYVGQSLNIALRFTRHRCDLNANRHWNKHLQRAWNKYGEQYFMFSVICCVIPDATEKMVGVLNELENYFICSMETIRGGYNLTTGGGNKVFSLTSRKKMSVAHKGKSVGRMVSQETREKLRIANTGKKLSADHRAKLSAARKGKAHPRKSGYMVGPMSDERKRKIGESQRGNKNHNFGKIIPESVKDKIRASNQGSACYLSKLDEKSVAVIKRRLSSGERGAALAREYRVASTQISCIKAGKTWRHVK